MKIPNDLIVYRISEYADSETMLKLGLTSCKNNRIYKNYEVKERKKCVYEQNLEYIYDRDNIPVEEKEELLLLMSVVAGKDVKYYKKKLLNLITSRKNGKKLQYNYGYLYEYFYPDRYTSWLFKYATNELLAEMYFRDIEGYKSFVEKSSKFFIKKRGKKRTHDLISWFINEIDMHNYIVENDSEDWWLAAVDHCFNRTDSDDLLIKLINKMCLFNMNRMFFDDILRITELIFSFTPTEDRIRYLSYFDISRSYLFFAVEESQAHIGIHDGYNSWMYYIIENKEVFSLEDNDFTRDSLEDMLLPYDFVLAIAL